MNYCPRCDRHGWTTDLYRDTYCVYCGHRIYAGRHDHTPRTTQRWRDLVELAGSDAEASKLASAKSSHEARTQGGRQARVLDLQAKVVAMRESGQTSAEISSAVGMHRSYVNRLLKRAAE